MIRELEEELYDVAIVGAGRAGLAAAEALGPRKLVVLEKEAAVEADASDADPGSERVGLFFEGSIHFGATPTEVLRQLPLAKAEKGQLEKWLQAPEGELPGPLRAAVESLYAVAHSGSFAQVLPARRRDALTPLAVRQRMAAEPRASRARALGDRLWLGAEVLSVVDQAGRVEVTYRRDGQLARLGARAVICATPGPITQWLIPLITNDRCRVWLDTLRYTQGAMVVLELSGGDLPDFGVLATPGLPFNAVLRQGGRGSGPQVLLFQYLGEQAQQLLALPPQEAARRTLESAQQLELGPLALSQVRAAQVRPWEPRGPAISDESYGRWHDWEARASERVYLAGPHVWIDEEPEQELRSGRKTAERVAHYLDVTPELDRLRSNYLVETSVYRLLGDRPVFLQRKLEGNVSFYGLMLQAHRNPLHADYLMHTCRAGMWEYQVCFGATGEDTLLPLEGLLHHGADPAFLSATAEKFVDVFYSRERRAFLTISEQRKVTKDAAQGLAGFWLDPSLDATAVAAYVLHKIDPQRYADEIRASRDFVVKTQEADGHWVGLWFPSKLVTTFHSVRALVAVGAGDLPSKAALEKARAAIFAGQGLNGSWNDSVIDSATAVLALKELGLRQHEAARRAVRWISSQRRADGWDGEPMMYYWYELSPDERLFFHCRDRGQITTAWATLALQE